MDNDNNTPEKFSDDPEEQLRIENEILKLRLQAELGGTMEQFENLPPELENFFLSNVLSFEHQHANAEMVTVYNIAGSPGFIKEPEITAGNITQELHRIEKLMEEKGIIVDYSAEYTDREKYRFITEELFMHETTNMQIPGMELHFSYEEFHPNHAMMIHERATDFIEHWFAQNFSEHCYELAFELLTGDGQTFTNEDVVKKIQNIFASYTSFENCRYTIENTGFDMEPGNKTGLGFAEGITSYNAILETGEVVHIEAPFKFYMQAEDAWWKIFFFHWPGFTWK